MTATIGAPAIERADSGALVVSSLTVADGAGVEHRAVLQLIGQHQTDFEDFGALAFEMRARPTGQHGGGTIRVAMLNEPQAMLLMTYQRNNERVRAFKMALIKGFFAMAQELARPRELSRREILQQALAVEIENEELKAQAAIAAPKAAAYDVLLSTVGDYSVNAAAKVLARDHAITLGERRLRDRLQEWGWIYRQRGVPRAKQAQIDAGRMAEKAQFHYHPTSGDVVLDEPQVRVTAKGVAAIRDRLLKEQNADNQ